MEYGGTVRVSGSLRKLCGLRAYHGTDAIVDQWLSEHGIRRVVVLLVDAMGTSVLHTHLKDDSFLISHMVESVSSVFPPTTTASTTSIRTGRMSSETGWLGWSQYFREVDDNVILFFNRSLYSDRSYPDFAMKTLPVVFTEDELGEKADTVWPGWSAHNPCQTFEDMWRKIVEINHSEDRIYVYAYWDALDTCMHRNGPSSQKAGNMLRKINDLCAEYAPKLKGDTAVVIVADHSQIDAVKSDLSEHPELVSCFSHLPSLEPRTAAFYVKKECREQFETEFRRIYGDDFDLYTSQQVIDMKLFGETMHERFAEFIGDYLAVGKGNVSLVYHMPDKQIAGDHAGGNSVEAMVPVILCQGGEK
ncbi:MAG: alkaline phosphatase family protein [Bulleidia sp.]